MKENGDTAISEGKTINYGVIKSHLLLFLVLLLRHTYDTGHRQFL